MVLSSVSSRRRLGVAALGALLLGAPPRTARADAGLWTWYEHRVRVYENQPQRAPTVDLRVSTDLRFNRRSDGLDMAFLRVGPILGLTPWASLAAHFTSVADRLPDGTFAAQYRPELDWNLTPKWDWFALTDRTRLELLLGAPGGVFRYRNMLRGDAALPRAPLGLFLFDEIFLRDQGTTFHENRASTGVRLKPFKNMFFDVGYMLHSLRGVQGWEHNHIALLWLIVTSNGVVHPVPRSTRR